MRHSKLLVPAVFISLWLGITAAAQSPAGKIYGTVRISPSERVVSNAVLRILETNQSVLTNERGAYEFSGMRAGKYQIVAHLDRLPETIQTIEFTGNDQRLDFELDVTSVREEVTVSATGSTEAVTSSYQPVTAVGVLELAQKNPVSIGEALEFQLGVAKRSFGPGSGRPVIRGFDGDRVLVLQDGLRLGGIASQSGDEVEPIDVLSLDRIELVKGPATLLYGSNAIGGVVNGISTNDVYQRGLSGYVTSFGATNSWQAGTSGGLKFGVRDFMLFGGAGAQKANDYRTPIDGVLNSYARSGNASFGGGWFRQRGWLSFNYTLDKRRYGIPAEAQAVDLEYLQMRRYSFTGKGGWRNVPGLIEGGDVALNYNDYVNREFEFESDENVTELDSLATNKNFNFRSNFVHRRRGELAGTFGFSGFTRDYESVGEEAPAPHTKQHSFAAFILEKLELEKIGFQFGGRIEQNSYDPDGDFRKRNFVGFSGSVGARLRLWNGGALVADYRNSFRAPALEELYNHGPHPGILVFDIGNENLKAEHSDGVDLSLRHNTKRLRLEAGAYYYKFRNFVFPAFTGLTDAESNLPIVIYSQGPSRYFGAEASIEAQALTNIWVTGKFDYTRAELTEINKPLPRITPARGTVGIDWRHKALNIRPELLLVAAQRRVADHETPTAGYVLVNVTASYAFVTSRAAHVISVSGYNLSDRLYRNHLSFIKEMAPEIGRHVRLSYMLRF